MRNLVLCTLCVVAVLLVPANARASEGGGLTTVGVRAAMLRGVGEHATTHFGPGFSVERSVVPHLLELELVANFLPTEHALIVPVELLAKLPFHPTRWLQPYLGLGPAMGMTFGEEETAFAFGGAAAAGSYFWLQHGLGLMLEVNYELLYEHGLAHEVGASAGVAWHF